MEQEIKVLLNLTKDTKNCWRFDEASKDGSIRSGVYVSKAALTEAFGSNWPERIEITIRRRG